MEGAVMALFTVRGVSKDFVSQSGMPIAALQNVNIDVEEGKFLCLVGRSGCGKTTLLRILAGLEQQSSGQAIFDGVPIQGCDPRRAMVFQDPRLFLWRTVSANVAFGLEVKGIPAAERRRLTEHYVELVGLKDFANAYPYELSGGMRQRVALARVLAIDPRVILMDEPFAALDALTRNRLQEELLRLVEVERKTVVFVTHSADEAVFLADRIAVFSQRPRSVGKILSVDLPKPRPRECRESSELKQEIFDLIAEYD
jgi:NitT/TauT family transport system ATP-binding protein